MKAKVDGTGASEFTADVGRLRQALREAAEACRRDFIRRQRKWRALQDKRFARQTCTRLLPEMKGPIVGRRCMQTGRRK